MLHKKVDKPLSQIFFNFKFSLAIKVKKQMIPFQTLWRQICKSLNLETYYGHVDWSPEPRQARFNSMIESKWKFEDTAKKPPVFRPGWIPIWLAKVPWRTLVHWHSFYPLLQASGIGVGIDFSPTFQSFLRASITGWNQAINLKNKTMFPQAQRRRLIWLKKSVCEDRWV